MPLLDVFSNNAFSTVSLTTGINRLPYNPGRLGAMGLFRKIGVTTTAIEIEYKNGVLALVPNMPRGVMTTLAPRGTRNARVFKPAHLPLNDAVYADDVQNIRSFGSESEIETVAEVVNERLQTMRQSIETTVEYHRIGALQGIVKDADGATELYDFFDEFDIAEPSVDFDFAVDAQDMKAKFLEVIELIETALGATSYDHIHAIAGKTFYNSFIAHATVKDAFSTFQENSFARQQQRSGFDFADITIEPYRGKVGTVDFIPAAEARFFPVGVPDLFLEIYAPAPFEETVNTLGKPVYAKQEKKKWGLGVDLHAQSNPLLVPTRPDVLVKGH